MDEFRQSDELIAECDIAKAKEEMMNRKFRARCIQWDRTDDDGTIVEADLPSDVVVSFEDLRLPYSATIEEIEDALALYLTDTYSFCHNGFFFEEVED